jgi:hypothetical protein
MYGTFRRRLRAGRFVAGAAAAALAFTSLAASAATPLSPETGATTSSHPVFTWALGPDEESDSVHIANRPETTPDGRFYDENIVMSGFVEDAGATTWSPSEALYAGRYWWNVETLDASFDPVLSAIREFTVAPEVKLLSARFSRYSVSRQVRAELRWVTNAPEVLVEIRFLQKRRAVGVVRERSETLVSQDPDETMLAWTAPRKVPRGARLVVVVRITGAGGTATTRRSLRAP